MAISTAVAATLAVMVLSAAAAAAADAPEKIGMPNCATSCGDVEVPFPFGVGADTSCYMPGFNLTCDRSHHPPRLLLGEHPHLRVASIYSSTPMFRLEVIRTVNLSTGWFDPNDGGSVGAALTAGGPYRLSTSNELVLTGCNVRATLQRNKGNVTVSGCFSFCDAYAGEAADRRILHSCRAPTSSWATTARRRTNQSLLLHPTSCRSAGLVGTCGWTVREPPVRAFLAREGWFREWLSNYSTTSDYPSTLDVPAYLDCDIGFGSPCSAATNNPCKSDHSVCINYITSISCECKIDYVGNAYVPDGCKAALERILTMNALQQRGWERRPGISTSFGGPSTSDLSAGARRFFTPKWFCPRECLGDRQIMSLARQEASLECSMRPRLCLEVTGEGWRWSPRT